jgi:glycosidase
VGSRLGEENIDLANALNLLLGGVPVTYYGEELGMVDLPKDKIEYEDCQDDAAKKRGPELFSLYSRDYERTPMQWSTKTNTAGFTDRSNVKTWLPVNSNYKSINAEVK